MKNITKWAAASAVIAIFGACTTEVTSDNGDGGTTSRAAGSASTTCGGSGGSGTGGSGGSGGRLGRRRRHLSTGRNPSACESARSITAGETCACDAKSTARPRAARTSLAWLASMAETSSRAPQRSSRRLPNAGQADDSRDLHGRHLPGHLPGRDGGPRPRR